MTAPATVTELLNLPLDNDRRAWLALDAMAGLIASFAPDYDTTVRTTRTFGYRGGRFIDDAGGWGFEPDGTIVCTDDATRYVHFDPVNGVTIAAGINLLRILIAKVVCAGGVITTISDLRDTNLNTPNRIRWRGPWSAGTYMRHDATAHVDALWIANTTTTQEPGTGSEWDLVVVGIPDPSLAGEDDVLTIVGGVPTWAAPTTGVGTLEVEDEGVSEETGVTRMNFIGPGVTAVGDSLGGVDVTISGTAGTPGGGGVVSAQEVILTADAGLGLSDGDPITTWGNQGTAGSAKDHANSGGGVRPIFRLADADDGLEYVEFDGTDDYVEKTGMTAYTGGELTAYLVARLTDNNAGDRLFSLVVAGANDTSSATGLALHYGSAHQLEVIRNTVPRSCTNVAVSGSRCYEVNFDWFAMAFRYRVVMGRAVLSIYHNNRTIGFDLGAASLTAFGFDISALGCGYSNAPGTKLGFPRMDVRHWSYGLAADSTEDIRDSLRNLVNKWKVILLD